MIKRTRFKMNENFFSFLILIRKHEDSIHFGRWKRTNYQYGYYYSTTIINATISSINNNEGSHPPSFYQCQWPVFHSHWLIVFNNPFGIRLRDDSSELDF